MDFYAKKLKMVIMKKWLFFIAGMLLSDSQIICCLNFRDIPIIMKTQQNLIKLSFH